MIHRSVLRSMPFATAATRQFTMSSALRHSFAALKPGNGEATDQGLMQLKGIVFDMDGTLCEPQNYMFGEMRAAVQIPKGEDILDHIHALPAEKQTEAFEKIRAIEREAMAKQIPQAGLVSLMEYLDRKGIKKGICTRNFEYVCGRGAVSCLLGRAVPLMVGSAPVTHLLETHLPGHINPFAPIVTREFRPPKPSPAGILHIAHAWGVVSSASVPETPPTDRRIPVIMVGDSVDDMASGHDAGCLTVLLRSPGKEDLETDERTHVVVSRYFVHGFPSSAYWLTEDDRLDELIALLEDGISTRR